MSAKLLTHLSQSFFIDKPCFVTKVDLFFSSKEPDGGIPFKFNIRRAKEGKPTNEILNFSQRVVQAANVNISSNANVATSVVFDAPIFLEVGEYAMNLGSDSRSYNVYVATLNDTDITTTRKITQQPALGTFFQSETLKTFIPSLFDDLKFKLYRAKFYTNVTATVNLVPDSAGQKVNQVFGGTLDSDPFELFKNLSTMKVYQFNHGYTVDSKVKFLQVANTMSNVRSQVSDVSSHNGHDSKMDAGNIFGLDGNVFHEVFTVANVKLNSYTVDLGAGKIPVISEDRFRFGGSAAIPQNVNFTSVTPRISTYKTSNSTINHKLKSTKVDTYTLDDNFLNIRNLSENNFEQERTLPTIVNVSHKLANTNPFQYKIEMFSRNDRVSPLIDTNQMGVFLKRNLVDNTNYSATVLEHEKLLISNIGHLNGLHGGAPAELHKANIYVDSGNFGTINFSNVADMANANAIINGSILNVQANTSQTSGSGANNSGLYRVIDVLAGSASNVNIKVAKLTGNIDLDTSNNNVYSIVHSNDFIAEEAATGSTNYSKYITREVIFNNASTGIRFILDALVPLNSNLDFYYKTKLAGDSTNFRDIEYKKVTDVSIPNSLDGEFVEFEKQVDDINAFNSIVFKIVFNSSNSVNAPKIKNFRLIAVS